MGRMKPSISAEELAAIGACIFMGLALVVLGWYTLEKLLGW